jgi:DNA polymerase III delta prime subunit
MLIAANSINILLISNSASGKTTILNALIREYYKDIPEKEYQKNILYINNLKEQGINYYRNDVKTFCQTCSNIQYKKKIVVLDDIDFINEQSQQVFRNCIDKYGNHVHFISSCSNSQKVIESLQSRLNIIKIKPLTETILNSIIDKIKTNENIIIDKDAQDFIIHISNNTIKIVINYMEKFKLIQQPITLTIANELCTNISFISFEKYTNYVVKQQLSNAIEIIYEIYNKGYTVFDILDNYFIYIKNTTILNEEQKYIIIPLLCKYITIIHDIHEDEIELALFTNNLINILQ